MRQAPEFAATMRRLVGLYLTQAAPMLDELNVAIQSKATGEVARLAHKLVGSSVSCGVQAFTQPFQMRLTVIKLALGVLAADELGEVSANV